MNSMELSNYLEKIRYGRKLTQEDFVDGVVSLRQYQRYRSGECEIPYEKIEAFANKLGIPSRKLINQFEQAKNIQAKLLNQFYNAVANRDYENIQDLKNEIAKDVIIDEEKKTYFNHALILDDFIQKRISEDEAFEKTMNLIDYPEILKQDYFTDIEVLILSSLLNYLKLPRRNTLLQRLTDLFDNESSIMSGGYDDVMHALILMRLSKSHGIVKNFSEVIRFCDLGISKGMERKTYHLWEYFYYYKALAYFRLEDYVNYEDSLFRCYNVLHMEGNKKKIELFTGYIEKDFNINFHNFVLNYLKKHVV